MLKKTLIVAGLSIAAWGVAAQTPNPILQRQQLMKGVGGALRPIGPMLKGDTPFDAAVVKASLATVSDNARKLPALYPDDSKTGNDTEALPKIWEEKAKFDAIYAKLGADATAASEAITDVASLRANMPKIFGDCKTCHDDYRAKK